MRRTRRWQDDACRVPCPHCSVKAPAWCQLPDGTRASELHHARVMAAHRAGVMPFRLPPGPPARRRRA